ncbi:MAG: threonine ammonia-lyase [Dehalococcoidia bacterium]
MDAPGGVTIDAIRRAREAIAAAVRLTPVWPSLTLQQLTGVPVLLKLENLQRTGSFKLRGASNFVHGLDERQRRRGLVLASAGNHAQGVALAGAIAGIDVTVVMPEIAPLSKISGARAYGATVVLRGHSLEEARAEALSIADREGRLYVPPFDDDDVIAGQGTVALEILEQVPDVEEILVPAGGGGLLGGVAVAVASLAPSVRVVGVQAHAMEALRRSREAGRIVEVPPARTIADGVAVAAPSARTFALAQRYVHNVISCSDTAIARAIVLLIERSKLIAEGAGALGVAALQSGAYRPRGKTVVVVSGGNIDINVLGQVVRRGLVEAGRYQRIDIEVADVPGELARVATAIAKAGGNVLEVHHSRDVRTLPVGVAMLELLVEVNDRRHLEEVTEALREAGLEADPHNPARLTTPDALRRHEWG